MKGDPRIASITVEQMRRFLAKQTGISKKTLLNMYIALSALWTWASAEGLVSHNILHDIPKPKPEQRAIEPLTEADVHAILGSLSKSRTYSRPGKRECQHTLGSSERNRAIILILLDTGIRATELCELKVANVDLQNKRILVMGKGAKERVIPISAATAQALWRYLSSRSRDSANSRVFVSSSGHPMERDDLVKLLARIGRQAGVVRVHPHRFREHTQNEHAQNQGGACARTKVSSGGIRLALEIRSRR
jgi:site-specific recombinase XerD